MLITLNLEANRQLLAGSIGQPAISSAPSPGKAIFDKNPDDLLLFNLLIS
ncbi:hypothetical protein [Phormidesmis priestleyi]